jgi:hypothetical protein
MEAETSSKTYSITTGCTGMKSQISQHLHTFLDTIRVHNKNFCDLSGWACSMNGEMNFVHYSDGKSSEKVATWKTEEGMIGKY